MANIPDGLIHNSSYGYGPCWCGGDQTTEGHYHQSLADVAIDPDVPVMPSVSANTSPAIPDSRAVYAVVIRTARDVYEVWSGKLDHPYPYHRDLQRGVFKTYTDAVAFADAINVSEFGEGVDE